MPERSWVPGSRVELHGLMISSPIERRATGLCANACCYIPLPRIGYTATWYHDEMLAGQGHNLSIVRQDFHIAEPVYKDGCDVISAFSRRPQRDSEHGRHVARTWHAVPKRSLERVLRGRLWLGGKQGRHDRPTPPLWRPVCAEASTLWTGTQTMCMSECTSMPAALGLRTTTTGACCSRGGSLG